MFIRRFIRVVPFFKSPIQPSLYTPTPVRLFGKAKKKAAGYRLTDDDRKKIEKVLKDPSFSGKIGVKNYPINEEVVFEGEAQVINWEDRRIGMATLEEARRMAAEQELDLVLMCEDPPTVRIMNYSRFIMKNITDTQSLNVKKSHSDVSRTIMLSNNISINDLETKLRKVKDFMKNNYKVIIEITKFDKTNPDEIKKTELLSSNIQEIIDSFEDSKNYSFSKDDRSYIFRIIYTPKAGSLGKDLESIVKNPEIQEIAYALNAKKTDGKKQSNPIQFSNEDLSDADEFMEDLLESEKNVSKLEKIEEDEEDITALENSAMFDASSAPHMNEEYYELMKNEQKITKLLGHKLAYNIKRGRIKLK